MSKRLYFLARKLNTIKNEKMKRIIIFIIYEGIIMFPLRLYFLFCKFLQNVQEKTLIEIIFFRVEGLIIAVMITTNVVGYCIANFTIMM